MNNRTLESSRVRRWASTALGLALLAACSPTPPTSAPPSGAGTQAPAATDAPTATATELSNELPPVGDVPFYKADAMRSGVHPGPGPVAKPIEAWRTELDCSVEERTGVVGAGLYLIGCDSPLLYALDARTGVERWRAELDAPISGSAAVAGGTVFAVDVMGTIVSLDLATGERRWSKRGTANGSLVVVDGTLYVATDDGFFGLSAEGGSIAWSWQSTVAGLHGTVVGDKAFVSTDDGQYRAISLADGSERWKIQVISGATTSPSMDEQTVFVGARQDSPTPSGELYAVDIASGDLLWRYQTETRNQIAPCAADDGLVYASSYEDGMFAFDGRTGDLRWTHPTPEAFCPLAKVGDVLYLFGDRKLWAFSAVDGEKLWDVDLRAFVRSGAVVTGGIAILGDDAGVIHGFAEPSMAQVLPSPGATLELTGRPEASPTASAVGSLATVATFDAETSDLDQPSGMDVGPDGSLYVVNAYRSEILVLAPDGTIVRRWGTNGSGEGQFDFRREPTDPVSDTGGVAVAADGSVYVADSANRRIQQFNANGTFIRQWGRFGTGDGQFVDPVDLDVGPDGTVYVVDDQRDDIQAFTSDGGFVRVIGEHGTGPGQLNYTAGIFVAGDSAIYNADFLNQRVQAWDNLGEFLWSVGAHGTGPGEFDEPRDVVVDDSGRLYAADRRRVQVFDAERQLVASWEVPGMDLDLMAVGGDTVYVGGPWDDHIYGLRLAE